MQRDLYRAARTSGSGCTPALVMCGPTGIRAKSWLSVSSASVSIAGRWKRRPLTLMPKRIQLSRQEGWRLPEGAKSVARPTRWGNPFRVGCGEVAYVGPQCGNAGRFDIHACGADLEIPGGLTAEQAIILHELDLEWQLTHEPEDDEDRAEQDELRAALEALRGYDLACWCDLSNPDGSRVWCHADTWLYYANR